MTHWYCIHCKTSNFENPYQTLKKGLHMPVLMKTLYFNQTLEVLNINQIVCLNGLNTECAKHVNVQNFGCFLFYNVAKAHLL